MKTPDFFLRIFFQVKHFLWGPSFPWPPIFHEFIQKIKKYRIYAFRIGKVKTNPKPTTYDFWAKLTKPKSMHNYYG